MLTTLEKVQRFEQYLRLTHGQSDSVLDTVLDKLLERKRSELARHRDEMRGELAAFEDRHGMTSREFYEKFERGEVGDAIDYFDWSATWKMYTSVLKYIEALSGELSAD